MNRPQLKYSIINKLTLIEDKILLAKLAALKHSAPYPENDLLTISGEKFSERMQK